MGEVTKLISKRVFWYESKDLCSCGFKLIHNKRGALSELNRDDTPGHKRQILRWPFHQAQPCRLEHRVCEDDDCPVSILQQKWSINWLLKSKIHYTRRKAIRARRGAGLGWDRVAGVGRWAGRYGGSAESREGRPAVWMDTDYKRVWVDIPQRCSAVTDHKRGRNVSERSVVVAEEFFGGRHRCKLPFVNVAAIRLNLHKANKIKLVNAIQCHINTMNLKVEARLGACEAIW